MHPKLYILLVGLCFLLCSCGSDKEQATNPLPAAKAPSTAIAAEISDKKDISPIDDVKAKPAADAAPQVATKASDAETSKPKPKVKPAKPEKTIAKPVKTIAKPEPKPAPQPEQRPILSFDATLFNYGKIAQGDIIMHEFEFTNTGDAELVVTDVRASCGCTQPTYPFLPILPGERGLIGVKFDSKGKLGKMKPIITITTNAEPAVTRLFLEGFVGDTVKDEKAKSTPANDSTLLH